jgi:hypothetical protein
MLVRPGSLELTGFWVCHPGKPTRRRHGVELQPSSPAAHGACLWHVPISVLICQWKWPSCHWSRRVLCKLNWEHDKGPREMLLFILHMWALHSMHKGTCTHIHRILLSGIPTNLFPLGWGVLTESFVFLFFFFTGTRWCLTLYFQARWQVLMLPLFINSIDLVSAGSQMALLMWSYGKPAQWRQGWTLHTSWGSSAHPHTSCSHFQSVSCGLPQDVPEAPPNVTCHIEKPLSPLNYCPSLHHLWLMSFSPHVWLFKVRPWSPWHSPLSMYGGLLPPSVSALVRLRTTPLLSIPTAAINPSSSTSA